MLGMNPCYSASFLIMIILMEILDVLFFQSPGLGLKPSPLGENL